MIILHRWVLVGIVFFVLTLSSTGVVLSQVGNDTLKLVAADLNGTWKIQGISHTRNNKPYKSGALESVPTRICSIADYERLSVWLVLDFGEDQTAVEFTMTDVTKDSIVFVLDTSFSHYVKNMFSTTGATQLRFDLKKRKFEGVASMSFPKDRFNDYKVQKYVSKFELTKFINSVPVQAISSAAKSRKEKMKGATTSYIKGTEIKTNEWIFEFLASLEPLADGVLEEYGKQLTAGKEVRVRQSGMAAAAALLKLANSIN